MEVLNCKYIFKGTPTFYTKSGAYTPSTATDAIVEEWVTINNGRTAHFEPESKAMLDEFLKPKKAKKVEESTEVIVEVKEKKAKGKKTSNEK